jgi:hypothetical protein
MMSSPEPMSLGSPHQSPSSAAAAAAQYLPQFLLGDSAPSARQSSAAAKYWMTGGGVGGSSSPPRTGASGAGVSSLGMSQQAPGSSSSLNRAYSHNVYEATASAAAAAAGKLNSTGFVEKIEPGYGYMHQSSSASSSSAHQGGVFSPLNAYGAFSGPSAGAAGGASGGPIANSSHSLIGGGMQAPITGSSNSLADVRQQVPGAPPINRLVDLLNKPSGSYLSHSPGGTTCQQEPSYGKTTFVEHYNAERPSHELSGIFLFNFTLVKKSINKINLYKHILTINS